jgi:hypothetical protein
VNQYLTWKRHGVTVMLTKISGYARRETYRFSISLKTGRILFGKEGDIITLPDTFHGPEQAARTAFVAATLQPGDTDSEYFENDTPEEMEFRDIYAAAGSFQSEELDRYIAYWRWMNEGTLFIYMFPSGDIPENWGMSEFYNVTLDGDTARL